MKKQGIIKTISPKPEGKNAFTLKGEQIDGKDVWFNGYSLDAVKGDEVEFEATDNPPFNNFSKLKVLNRAEEATDETPSPPTPPLPPTENPAATLTQNEEIAKCLTMSIIAQKHDNLVTIEGAIQMFGTALSELNRQSDG